MGNLFSDLVSYLFTFMGLICGLLFMFPIGWAVFLFCVLTEPKNSPHYSHIEKEYVIAKKT
ncbi:MAG: hypothetical protein PHD41_09565 [Methanosarcinaceae archaeon]|nr:hypothetical protein [Methanosarcinaceae archaeon]